MMKTLGKVSMALLSGFILVSANIVSADSYLNIGVSSGHSNHNYQKHHKHYKGHAYTPHYYSPKAHYRSHYKGSHKYRHKSHGDRVDYFVGGLVIGGVLGHALKSDHHDSYRRLHTYPQKRVVVHRSYTKRPSYTTYAKTNRGQCYLVTEHGYGRNTLTRVPRRNCR